MNLKEVVPKDKSDVEFINELAKHDIQEVKSVVPELLTWLQDYNWPAAEHVADYLAKYSNDIEDEILSVLKGSDDVWKYWVVFTLVLHSKVEPNEAIMEEVRRIANTPTASEKVEEVDEIAQEAITKYNNA